VAIDPESLLAHGDFIRLLARRLVLDEQSADDVVQQTWLAAIEHPPRNPRSLPGWLSMVARNFAFMTRRGDRNRRHREEAAAASEKVPSAAEILEKEVLRRRVIDEVMALEEPYRHAVLLRFYEDLPPRRIAARLDIPVETVKTRIKRGLARLRERLDGEFGGRSAWCLALAPLAGLKVAGTSTAAAGASGSAAAGAPIGSGTAATLPGASTAAAAGLGGPAGLGVKVVACAVVVLAGVSSVWFLLPDGSDPIAPRLDAETAAVAGVDAENLARGQEAAAAGLEAETDAASNERIPLPPASTEVVWQGRLIDYTGLPAAGVAIELRLVEALHARARPSGEMTVASGSGGIFEIRGLVPGDYSLHLGFTRTGNRPDWYKWGELTFDAPGIVQRDILVAEGEGAIVAGVVIDEASGQPIKRSPPYGMIDFYVGLNNPDHQGQGIAGEVDHATGTFCLRGLPAMSFDLILCGPGFHWKVYPSYVDTSERKIIDDLRLTVPPLGDLRISFTGFSEEELRKKLEANFEMAWGSVPGPARFFRKDQTYAAPEGKGCVTFSHATLGIVVRSFDIKRGEVFEIALCREDFGPDEDRPVSVNVILKQPDGSPLANATVGFQKNLRYRLPGMGKLEHAGVTGADGRATIDGIDPGFWSAWCTLLPPGDLAKLAKIKSLSALPETLRVHLFHGIEIPRSPEPDFCIELVMPGGAIRGELCSRATGLPLDDGDMFPRWIMINDPGSAFRLEGITLVRTGSRFELKGIKAGRYELTAAVFGFEQYMSGLFSVAEGETFDVGAIMLEPVGTMEIEARDPAGKPLRFDVDWEGKKDNGSSYGLDSTPIAEGITAFGRLPFGPLEVRVSAYGYKSEKITIEIERSRRARASVVLEPVP